MSEFKLDKNGFPKSKMFEPLYEMQCWPEVFRMLKDSESVPKITAYIQDDRKECLSISRRTLQTYLYKFLHASNEIYQRDQAIMSHIPLIQSLGERVDPQDVYQLLVGIQFERVSMAFTSERANKKVSKEGNDAVRVLSDVLESMSRTEKKKFDSAAVESTVVDVVDSLEKAKKVYEDRFGSVAATILQSPDSRRRVLNLLEMVRSATTGEFGEKLSKRKEGDTSQ